MGIFDQVVLALYTISLAVISGLIVLVTLGWQAPLEVLGRALYEPGGRWAIGLVGALFFVSSIRLLYFVFRRRGPGETLVRHTEHGEVQIALAAVENLVNRIGRQVEDVRDLRARVSAAEEGLEIAVTATVGVEASVPDLADRLQALIKRQVRHVVGIEVGRIRITIEDIGAEGRRRRVE